VKGGGHEITPPHFFESIFLPPSAFFLPSSQFGTPLFFFAILESKNGFSIGKKLDNPPKKMTSPARDKNGEEKGE